MGTMMETYTKHHYVIDGTIHQQPYTRLLGGCTGSWCPPAPASSPAPPRPAAPAPGDRPRAQSSHSPNLALYSELTLCRETAAVAEGRQSSSRCLGISISQHTVTVPACMEMKCHCLDSISAVCPCDTNHHRRAVHIHESMCGSRYNCRGVSSELR